jgi:polysaccharide pyruvyl transferase WcaK-like protein
MKVVLKGYYGKGNLGDDILMIVSFQLAKDLFGKSQILICSDGLYAAYINKMLRDVEVIKSNERINVDWIVHGGGGVYFDFEQGNKMFALLNFIVRLISYNNYRKIYFLIQSIRRNIGIKAKSRIGWGIGIGTYTNSSKKLYADILSLIDYKYLLVRDKESIDNLAKYKVSYPIRLGTDLAFLDHFWNKSKIQSKGVNRKTVGVILRDWPLDEHSHLHIMRGVAIDLERKGYQLKFFSFDLQADKYYLNLFSNYEMFQWDPFNITLESFLHQLSEVDWIVSSRAHGSIISTCIGIPVVSLGIEPKLKNVSEMLSYSSLYIASPFEKDVLVDTLCEFFNDQTDRKPTIEMDLSLNKKKIMSEIELMEKFIFSNSLQ